jgi:hypothetical protein
MSTVQNEEWEEPRSQAGLPVPLNQPRSEVGGSPFKTQNFFRVREDANACIIPQKHSKEETLQIKVPHSILKASASEHESLNEVFESETNRKKKVEFCVTQSNSDEFSVYDSHRHLKQSARSNYMSVAGSSALDDSTFKHNKDINRFIKNQNTDLSQLEESVIAESFGKLQDKMMNAFPVFAYNDDYLRALSLIIQNKVNSLKALLTQFTDQVEEETRVRNPPREESPQPQTDR